MHFQSAHLSHTLVTNYLIIIWEVGLWTYTRQQGYGHFICHDTLPHNLQLISKTKHLYQCFQFKRSGNVLTFVQSLLKSFHHKTFLLCYIRLRWQMKRINFLTWRLRLGCVNRWLWLLFASAYDSPPLHQLQLKNRPTIDEVIPLTSAPTTDLDQQLPPSTHISIKKI